MSPTTPAAPPDVPRTASKQAAPEILARLEDGTTVERLQELNPELDPQGLVAGQKIKLRE